MAIIASAFDGSWIVVMWLVIGMITTYGSRVLGRHFADKVEAEHV